jgi:hypothetical protein
MQVEDVQTATYEMFEAPHMQVRLTVLHFWSCCPLFTLFTFQGLCLLTSLRSLMPTVLMPVFAAVLAVMQPAGEAGHGCPAAGGKGLGQDQHIHSGVQICGAVAWLLLPD